MLEESGEVFLRDSWSGVHDRDAYLAIGWLRADGNPLSTGDRLRFKFRDDAGNAPLRILRGFGPSTDGRTKPAPSVPIIPRLSGSRGEHDRSGHHQRLPKDSRCCGEGLSRFVGNGGSEAIRFDGAVLFHPGQATDGAWLRGKVRQESIWPMWPMS